MLKGVKDQIQQFELTPRKGGKGQKQVFDLMAKEVKRSNVYF